MRTLAVLPIKSFDEAKQRLAEELDPGRRRSLVEAMFCDVLIALRRATMVNAILVVTGDPGAAHIAGGYGAAYILAEDQGHNPAASVGIARALDLGAERVLLVPGDCPLLDPKQLDELLSRPVAPRAALIVPDRHGTGTNALLLRPPDALVPGFGPDSRERHVSLAKSDSTVPWVVEVPSLALDVDTPDDLAALERQLAESHGGAAHTRGTLRQLMRSRR
jgi:2-phospho-L-lactate guanylyltransferase